MRTILSGGWVTGIAGMLLLAGASLAQQQAPKSVEAQRSVDRKAEKGAKLTHPERQKQADKALMALRKALKEVFDMEQTARREKDIVRLNCLREKSTALKGLLRVAEQAVVGLEEAAIRNEEETANYEFQRIGLAASKAGQIRTEAMSCVGEVAVYTGPVQVILEVDPSIPPKDPTELPNPVPRIDHYPALDRPQALSPPM
jgi:hypothetical protein